MGAAAAQSDQAVRLLNRTLLSGGIGSIVLGYLRLVSTYQSLQNRIRLVTRSEVERQRVTQELLRTAVQTRTAFDSTVELYARLAFATQDLGVEQSRLIGVTRSLNQAVILSGAGIRESQNAIIQLSQGLASGTLRGDELRSVLEQLPFVADVISKSFGVTRGALRFLAAEGLVTTEAIIEAFEKAGPRIERQFVNAVLTPAQAFSQLRSAFTQAVGRADELLRVSALLALGMQGLAASIDFVVAALASLAIGFGVFFTISRVLPIVAGLVVSLRAAAVASRALGAGLLFLPLSAGPIGLVAAALTGLGLSLEAVTRDAKTGKGAMSEFFGVLRDEGLILKEAAKEAATFFSTFTLSAGRSGNFSLSGIIDRAAQASVAEDLRKQQDAFDALREKNQKLRDEQTVRFDRTISLIRDQIDAQQLLNGATDLETSISQRLTSAKRELKEANVDLAVDDREARLRAIIAESEALKAQQQVTRDLTRLNEDLNNQIRATVIAGDQEVGLGSADFKLSLFQEQFRLESEILRIKGKISDEDRAQIALIVGKNIRLHDARTELEVMQEIIGDISREAERINAASDLRDKGVVTPQQFRRFQLTEENRQLQFDPSVSSGVRRGLNSLELEITDFASQTEATIVGAFNSAENALLDFVQTGKLSISDFTSSVSRDLLRLAFRQAISGVLGSFFPAPTASAKGNVFAGGAIQPFARGGAFTNSVVSAPTLAPMALFGERGPEAIAPLARDSEGNLGIRQVGGGGTTTVNLTVVTPDAASFKADRQVSRKLRESVERGRRR